MDEKINNGAGISTGGLMNKKITREDLLKYIYLKDLVADCGGIEKFRFYGYLDKYTLKTPFGFSFTSNSDYLVECKIEDDKSFGDLYTLEHGYKVNIVPVDNPMYAGRRYYQSDLLSMIKDGVYILKTSDSQHIEYKVGYERLFGDVYLRHEWQEIVE